MRSLTLVTPTYNEKNNIQRLSDFLAKLFNDIELDYELIVIDDNSPDGTGQLVDRLADKNHSIVPIHRPHKMGLQSAYLEGVKRATKETIILMDSDFSHDPSTIPEMIEKLDETPIVLGSRFTEGGGFKTLTRRKIGTTLLNVFIRWLFGMRIRDYTNGFIAIKKDVLHLLLEEGEKRNIFPFDIVIYTVPLIMLAHIKSIPIVEVPTTYVYRTWGKSKLNIWSVGSKTLFYVLTKYWLLLKEW